VARISNLFGSHAVYVNFAYPSGYTYFFPLLILLLPLLFPMASVVLFHRLYDYLPIPSLVHQMSSQSLVNYHEWIVTWGIYLHV
jgi:hypothetical protein